MERHWDAASQGDNAAPVSDGSMVSRRTFCDYLVGAREQRRMSINDIATVTRIPVRSLERLESGQFEELPADVFVRGFLRSYARCVGLNAEDTIRRYTHCGMTPAPVSSPMAEELASALSGPSVSPDEALCQAESSLRRGRTEGAQLVKDTRAAPAPIARSARHGEQVTTRHTRGAAKTDGSDAMAASDPQSRRKRKRRKRKQGRDLVEASAMPSTCPTTAPITSAAEAAREPRRARTESALQTTLDAATAPSAASPSRAPGLAPTLASGLAPTLSGDASLAGERAATASAAVDVSGGAAQPLVTRVHAQSQSVRPQPARRARASAVTTRAVPVLVIDDDHPEEAALSQEQRVERTDASWRSFLPPSLLDSDDGSRRGTLTLAVIILVIVATLTMSYLLRRPNVSGDGVTWQAPTSGETSTLRANA